MKPKLKPPGTKRWKVSCDMLLSTSAFRFNLRRYTKVTPAVRKVWARLLTAVPNSRLVLKAKPFACQTIQAGGVH